MTSAPETATLDDDPVYRRRLLLTVMMAVMGFGSLMTIVTVSLGEIAEDLGTNRTTLGWIVTGLMLTMAVVTPLGGKLGDIRGHRKIFLIGLAGSIVTTALCGIAWNAASLIGFRVLFGLTGALVQPAGMALMMQAYGPKRRATAMGWFQFATTGAPTIGLVIGGPMVDVIGWRGMFFAFAVVAVVAFLLAVVVVRESPLGPRIPLDVLGAITLGSTILGTLLAISRVVRTGPLDGLVVLFAAVAVVSVVAFVRVERRAAHPLLRLDYFKRRQFTAPLAANALTQFAYMGGFVVTPLLLGDVYGYSVGIISLVMAPRPGAFALSSPIGGMLASRLGERVPMALAGTCMISSMLAFAAGSRPGWLALIILGLLLSGISAGIGQPAYGSLVASSVDQSDLGVATGMNQTMLFVGIVSGIQIMLVVLGDSPSDGRYAATFLFGGAVAVLGLVAALIAGRQSRAATVPA